MTPVPPPKATERVLFQATELCDSENNASLKHLLCVSTASDKGLCACFGLKCGLTLFNEYLKKSGILSTAVLTPTNCWKPQVSDRQHRGA